MNLINVCVLTAPPKTNKQTKKADAIFLNPWGSSPILTTKKAAPISIPPTFLSTLLLFLNRNHQPLLLVG